ncbi:MAG: hypothetical protein HYU36_11920 [Planctomycetes bacterium]|nr:hypothetical protein [Planctomycetota bacterium]
MIFRREKAEVEFLYAISPWLPPVIYHTPGNRRPVNLPAPQNDSLVFESGELVLLLMSLGPVAKGSGSPPAFLRLIDHAA